MGEITVPAESAYDPGEHLNCSDVTVDSILNPTLLKVRIKASKTDSFHQGVELFIGKTGNRLCPVAALLAYLAKRGYKEGMLFHFEDGKLLTTDRFVSSLREALNKAGVDSKSYAGHSFRMGQPQQLVEVVCPRQQFRHSVGGRALLICCIFACHKRS